MLFPEWERSSYFQVMPWACQRYKFWYEDMLRGEVVNVYEIVSIFSDE